MGSGLSEEQRDQVHKIMEGQRATLGPAFDKLATLNAQLSEKLFSTAERVRRRPGTARPQIADTRETLVQDGVKVALQVRALLTPEQLAKVASVHKRLEALEEERRQLLGDDVLFLAN